MNSYKDEILKGYYHCIDCNSLFEVDFKKSSGRVFCDKCGNEPSAKNIEHAFKEPSAKKYYRSKKGEDKSMSREKQSNRTMLCFSAVILIIILSAVISMKKSDTKIVDEVEESGDANKNVEAERQKRLIKDRVLIASVAECNAVMNSFVRAQDGLVAAGVVYNNIALENDIKSYYEANPVFVIDEPTVTATNLSYIRDVSPVVIGGVFKDESGEEFEASFIESEKGYRIDWPFYVRHNRGSLEEFLNQSVVLESDFRLYMRVLDIHDQITLVLYPPRVNSENGFEGMKSFSIRLPENSELASSIMDVLNDADPMDKGYRAVTVLRDPKGCHRVRLRLRRKVNEGKPNSLELVKFIANDWYGVDIKNLESSKKLEAGE